jgi:hypothetical protein
LLAENPPELEVLKTKINMLENSLKHKQTLVERYRKRAQQMAKKYESSQPSIFVKKTTKENGYCKFSIFFTYVQIIPLQISLVLWNFEH